jgi:hypothetical protein
MNEILHILTNLLNNDVALIIINQLNFRNHSLKLKYCVDQINFLNKEFDYIIYIKKNGQSFNYNWCPDLKCQFILLKNREKMSTNFKKIKKDCIYGYIY